MSKFTLIKQMLGYDDESRNSNPILSGINRKISVNNIPVENPQTLSFNLPPGNSNTVFSGTRTLAIDGTTVFSLTLSPINPTTYRLLNTAGTAPVFRTDRGVNLNGIETILSVGANFALTVTAATGTPFTSVQVGDTMFIPGITTGDSAGPFNTLNEGYWFVKTTSPTVMVVTRNPVDVFSGITETVTPSTTNALQVFSSDNVQIGDSININAGFASSIFGTYIITAVNPLWVEFQSVLPLGNQTGVEPGSSGIVIYSMAKRWIFIQTDQTIVYKLNGDTGSFNTIVPPIPGCGDGIPGTFDKWGPVWQLVVQNTSLTTATIIICTVD